MKICSACGDTKPLTEFYKGHGRCKSCYAIDQQLQRRKHLEKRRDYDRQRPRRPNPARDRARSLERRFGITQTIYDGMLEMQDFRCAICRRFETKARHGLIMALAVDHCHKTSKVRGLLCNSCNLAIGKMGEVPSRFRDTATYLEVCH